MPVPEGRYSGNLLYMEKLTELARTIFVSVGSLECIQCDLWSALTLPFTSLPSTYLGHGTPWKHLEGLFFYKLSSVHSSAGGWVETCWNEDGLYRGGEKCSFAPFRHTGHVGRSGDSPLSLGSKCTGGVRCGRQRCKILTWARHTTLINPRTRLFCVWSEAPSVELRGQAWLLPSCPGSWHQSCGLGRPRLRLGGVRTFRAAPFVLEGKGWAHWSGVKWCVSGASCPCSRGFAADFGESAPSGKLVCQPATSQSELVMLPLCCIHSIPCVSYI